jgi:hypothetical protein
MAEKPRKKDQSGDRDRIARLAVEIAAVLDAPSVTVKLQNGGDVVGSFAGFGIRKRESKKGEASWIGNVRIQTDPGVLEIDCLTVESIAATPK